MSLITRTDLITPRTEHSEEMVRAGNELILKFMKLEETKGVFGDSRIYYRIPYYHDSLISAEDDFRYHISLDWLLPVIRKITDTYAKTDIRNSIKFGHQIAMTGGDVGLMFKVVINFIPIKMNK